MNQIFMTGSFELWFVFVAYHMKIVLLVEDLHHPIYIHFHFGRGACQNREYMLSFRICFRAKIISQSHTPLHHIALALNDYKKSPFIKLALPLI